MKKLHKQCLLSCLFLVTGFILFMSCGSSVGPEGPRGPQGPSGSGFSDVPVMADPETGVNRIANVLLKLKNGGSITFAALGGSITQGGCVDGVNDWLQAKAEASGGSVTYVNAGIGASDSGVGLLRLKDHVLRHDPDLVIFEYSVNDATYYLENGNWPVYNDPKPEGYQRFYEGLVRQSLKDSDRAIFCLLLNTSYQGKGNFNAAHSGQWAVGLNYNLPIFRWLDYEKGSWWATTDNAFSDDIDYDKNFYQDVIHPGPGGNASISAMITEFLDDVWAELPATAYTIDKTLPAPRYSDCFDNIAFIDYSGADFLGGSGVTISNMQKGSWAEFVKTASNVPMLPNAVYDVDRWDNLSTDDFKAIKGFVSTSNSDTFSFTFTGAKAAYVISTFIYNGGFTGGPGADKWAEAAGEAKITTTANTGTSLIYNHMASWESGKDFVYVGSAGFSETRDYYSKFVYGKLNPATSYNMYIKSASSGKTNVWGVVIGY